MATRNEIAYSIAMDLGKDLDVDFIEQLKFDIDATRALLVRRDIENNAMSREYNVLISLQVENVDVADSCYVEIGCNILRTVVKVPLPLRYKSSSPFKYVGAPRIPSRGQLRAIPHSYIEPESIAFLPFDRRINKNYPLYTYVNGYLYFYHVDFLEVIQVEDPFADPLAAHVADLCKDTTNCYSDDDPYPAPTDMIPLIKRMIFEEKLAVIRAGLPRTVEVPVDEVPEKLQ